MTIEDKLNDDRSMSAEEREAHRAKMQRVKEEHAAKVRAKEIRRGVIVVHTGDGKGKSTAGFGMAIRAAGHGQSVGIVQFIKGTWKTGEQQAFRKFENIVHVVSGDGFTWNTQDREKDVASARHGWKIACEMIEASRGDTPQYDLIVLDELNFALSIGLLNPDEVASVLRQKPDELSICVTGRGAPDAIVEVADTVSEARMIKHAYEAGIRARRGVEF